MVPTALVWFRRDLRIHDHPPLRAALDAHERIVPVFVLEDRLLDTSPSRTAFLFDCLRELRASLDGKLVVVRGKPEHELPKLAREHGATAAYFASDVSPFARGRDERVVAALREAGVEPRRTPGNFIADIGKLKPYAVFTPFWRAWQQLPRREIHGAPRKFPTPSDLRVGEIPTRRSEVDPVVPAARRPAASACSPGITSATTTIAWTATRPCSPRTCTSAASAPASSRSAPAAPTHASSPGATSTPTSSCTTRTTSATRTGASSTTSSGRHRRALRRLARGPHRLPGGRRRDAPARRRPAGCTTARG